MMRRKSLLHHFVVLVVVHRLQRRQLAQPPLSILAWRRTLAVDGSILVRKVCLPWCVRIQLRWNIKNECQEQQSSYHVTGRRSTARTAIVTPRFDLAFETRHPL